MPAPCSAKRYAGRSRVAVRAGHEVGAVLVVETLVAGVGNLVAEPIRGPGIAAVNAPLDRIAAFGSVAVRPVVRAESLQRLVKADPVGSGVGCARHEVVAVLVIQ